jgi:hypothetical protein
MVHPLWILPLVPFCSPFPIEGNEGRREEVQTVERFDVVERSATFAGLGAGANPFVDAEAQAIVTGPDGRETLVNAFCSADGAEPRFTVRIMPRAIGRHSWKLVLRRRSDGGKVPHELASGAFDAVDGRREGPVRVDPKHPFHFLREGTGRSWFWNGTTTYWLLGWKDDATIAGIIDRLARLKVNRIRVAISGRTKDGNRWFEPLNVPTPDFQFKLDAWPAARPDDIENPGHDVTRFNLTHFEKLDRLVRHARDKGVVVSLIFFLDGADKGAEPFGKKGAGGPDERRYYRYVAARYGAFDNVMWDVTNEYRLCRDDAWAKGAGEFLRANDPWRLTTSIHGHGDFRFRKEPWVDYAMYQSWDEHGGYRFMRKNRADQLATGRPMPQVNEEYGYEDHYPGPWGGGRKAPARSADNRRRLAWEISMAGGYQTTGERADTGTGKGRNTGGGWINGRGDDSMTMLVGYGHMVDCFTSLDWWKMDPVDGLTTGAPAHVLAEPGRRYLVYLPAGGRVTVKLSESAAGSWKTEHFDPRTGRRQTLGSAAGPAWSTPTFPEGEDHAVILTAEERRSSSE